MKVSDWWEFFERLFAIVAFMLIFMGCYQLPEPWRLFALGVLALMVQANIRNETRKARFREKIDGLLEEG